MDRPSSTTAGVDPFEDLFNLDVRVTVIDRPGRCSNHTNDGCSQSCPSVGCSATCHCR